MHGHRLAADQAAAPQEIILAGILIVEWVITGMEMLFPRPVQCYRRQEAVRVKQ